MVEIVTSMVGIVARVAAVGIAAETSEEVFVTVRKSTSMRDLIQS